MKNIFYFRNINKIGGIETFFYQLAKEYQDWDITVYYNTGNLNQINRLKKFIRVIKYSGEKIKCDKAFFNFNTDIINNVEAKEYGLILHGDYKAMINSGQLEIKQLPLHPKINTYYGVSQLVCDSFEELTGIKPKLIYNPIEVNKPKRILNLISATRLTKEKGKERIKELARALEENNIPYIWSIYTDDRDEIKNSNIVYREPRLDIVDYIANADYLVQLSDNEGYCYSIIEALLVGTPVISTNLPVLKELGLNSSNSFILDFDMKSIPIKDIYEKELKFEYEPKKDNWYEILEKGNSIYKEELKMKYKVESLNTYKELSIKDQTLDRIPEVGEQWEISKERLDILLGDNKYNKAFVKVVEVIKEEPVVEKKEDKPITTKKRTVKK